MSGPRNAHLSEINNWGKEMFQKLKSGMSEELLFSGLSPVLSVLLQFHQKHLKRRSF